MSNISLRMLGDRLRRERGQRGVREVSREIGISPATLSRVERGNLPDLDTFAKICGWLRIDPAEILGVDLAERSQAATGGRLHATAHFRADKTPSPELAKALADMILATEEMLRDER